MANAPGSRLHQKCATLPAWKPVTDTAQRVKIRGKTMWQKIFPVLPQ